MACPEELMIPQYQEDLGKMITLPLKEFEVRLIVFQVPNVSSKDQVWSFCGDIKVPILPPNLKMQIGHDLKPGPSPEVAIEKSLQGTHLVLS